MLRCQTSHDWSTKSVYNTRPQPVADTIPKHSETVDGAPGEQRSSHQVRLGREPQNNKENEPSTSQDHQNTRVVSGPDVLWKRRPNTKQLDASDSRVVVQRY